MISADRILFITLSNIGDAIMTTPVLQTLHCLYPGSVIDMVVDRRSRELFEHCPWRGELIQKNKREFMRGFPRLVHKLRRNRYRLAVDLRTDLLLFFLRADKKFGKWNSDSRAIHSVEKHLSIIRSISKDRLVDRCCLWTGHDDENYAKVILEQAGTGKLLCVAPGANSQKKIWNWKNYGELIDRLNTRFGRVLLLGNANDSAIAEKINETVPSPAFNLCGKTTLLQAAAILRQASLFVGNDSGLGHMASATGVPTCTLFGPGQPERYRPWGENAVCIAGDNQEINAITVSNVIDLLEHHSLLT